MTMEQQGNQGTAGRRPLPDRCARLQSVLHDTRRALKNRNLFAHIEDHGADQLSAIFVRLEQLMRDEGALVLRVEVSTLHWGEHAVLEDDARDFNFVFPLFHTGVRRLVFRPGLLEHEFISFWTHVGKALLHQDHEDLLTRLWRESFKGISWVAHVEIDEPDDETARLQRLVSEAREALARGPSVEREMLDHRKRMAVLVRALKRQRASLDLARCVGPNGDPAVLLPELEAERSRVQVGVGQSLFDIATVASHPETGEFLALGFAQVALSLLQDEKLGDLSALAAQAQQLLAHETRPKQRKALGVAVDGLARELRTDDAAAQLLAALQSGDTMPPEALSGLAWLLAAFDPTPALLLLEASLPATVSQALRDALAAHAATNAVMVARKLRSAPDALAKDLLDVVQRMALAKKVFLLEPGLQHRSADIRGLALQGILRCGEESAAATAIGRAIPRCTHIDERLSLIASLTRVECSVAERFVIERLEEPDLVPVEVQALWTTLLQFTTQTSLAVAKGVITQPTRGLLGASHGEDKKTALVEAAGALGGIRSFTLLSAMLAAEENSSRSLVKRAHALRTHVAEVLGVPL